MTRIASLLLAGSCLAGPAVAQVESGDAPPPEAAEIAEGVGRVYTPADFTRFSPITALDMVRQIPGFTIDQAEQRRGLGQGGANVLINGQRISGKSNDAITTLRRISASDVTRIEIRDAATLDIPGLTGQVVNIVAQVNGMSGSFSWNPQFRLYNTDPRLFSGEISINGSTGAFDYSISLANNDNAYRSGNDGIERVFGADGAVIDRRYEVGTFDGDSPTLSGTLRYDGPGSSVGNLNLSYGRYYERGRENSTRAFPGTVDRFRTFRDREDETNYEIGGDYEFALGPGRLKLIGLHRVERSPTQSTVITQFADGSSSVGSRFARLGDESEYIARTEYGWQMGGDWQFALEGARNTLDVAAQLFTLDPNGDFRELPLPGGSAFVSENRAEANLTYGRPIAEGVTVQASLGAEYSKLSQTGAGGLTRTFYRPKGFVNLAWETSETLDLSARIEREVGQLNFFDFVANVNVSNENQNASNPNLVPPQSWKAEVEATKELGPWGSVTARLYYQAISDIVDQIPLGPTDEAPGNLDSATIYGLEWNSTFNFDPIGWHGAKLDLQVTLEQSRLDDPLTGVPRPISERQVSHVNAELRHDIPSTEIAYGFEFERHRRSANYRLTELGQSLTAPALLGVYVEHKDVFGLRVRASVFNLLGSYDDYTRTVYAGRRTGPVAFTEYRHRRIGPIFTFTISGTF